jgi:hypothetical protein
MHGAAGGAPKGNRNAFKHGAHSAETLALKRQITALARLARETMAGIEQGKVDCSCSHDEFPLKVVRIDCGRRGRTGSYRRDSLVAWFGADAAGPDLEKVTAPASG